MSSNNNCENCWTHLRQFFSAAVIAPDGQKLCLTCVRALEVDIDDCDPITDAPATQAEFAQRAWLSAREKSTSTAKEVAENRESAGADSPPRPLNAPAPPKQAPTSDEEKPGEMEKRKCGNPECGKEFTPPHALSNYCSVPCRGRANYLKKIGGAPKTERVPRKKRAVAVRNGQEAGEIAAQACVVGPHSTTELEERNAVLEAQLEKMVDLQWAGLPLDRKVAALTRELSLAD